MKQNKEENELEFDQFTLALGGLLLYTFIIFFMAWPAQFLWNMTLVKLFPIDSIEYMDMVRLMLLVRLLFPIGGVGKNV